MTDDEIIQIMHEHFEGLFPKTCPKCGRRFETLKEYVLNTQPIGTTISYDAEIGDWETTQPLGGVALANCLCGTTIALTTDGMSISQIHLVLKWIKKESQRRGLNPNDLTDYIRREVRKRVLNDPV